MPTFDAFEDETRRISDVQGDPEQEDTTFVFSIPVRNQVRSPSPEMDQSEEEIEEQESEADEEEPPEEEHLDEQPEELEVDEELDETIEIQPQSVPAKAKPIAPKAPRKKAVTKLSRNGTPYPSLPISVVRQMVGAVSKSRGRKVISKDTLTTIMQATDLFFEQISDDLGAYSSHAGRKTIEESDVIALMRR
jgi:histone H3/H4